MKLNSHRLFNATIFLTVIVLLASILPGQMVKGGHHHAYIQTSRRRIRYLDLSQHQLWQNHQ